MEKVNVNDVELEYEVVGSGDPVLLVSPVLADSFLPLLSEPALATGFTLIRYHRRGWAGSTHTPPPVTVADHAADAASLLVALGFERVHVAGHSSGGSVALQLALDNPERLRSLILLEPALLSVPAGAGFLEQAEPAFAAYGAGDPATALARFMSVVGGTDWPACRALLDERIPGSVEQAIQDADTFFGVELPAVAEWRLTADDAARIDRPVLSVLGSETEPLWLDVAAFLSSSLPDVEECVLDGIGHFLHIQRPEPVAQAMADFLARHPLAEAEAAGQGGLMVR